MLKNCEQAGNNRHYGDAQYSGAKVMSEHNIVFMLIERKLKKEFFYFHIIFW